MAAFFFGTFRQMVLKKAVLFDYNMGEEFERSSKLFLPNTLSFQLLNAESNERVNYLRSCPLFNLLVLHFSFFENEVQVLEP